MPAIIPHYDVNDKIINDLWRTEQRDRDKQIDLLWAFYEGDHPQSLFVEDGLDYNVVINMCAQTVDKLISFFSPRRPVIEFRGDQINTGAADKLSTFWEDNLLETFVVELAQTGFISGHSFIKILPLRLGQEIPEIALLDTSQVSVFWNIGNKKEVLFYRLSWKVGDVIRIQDIIPTDLFLNTTLFVDGIEAPRTWVIAEYESKDGGEFKQVAGDHWEFDFPPIVDITNFPTKNYYGQSDLRHAALNQALNFVASNTNKIIYHHAAPRTVLTGGTLPEDANSSPNTIIEISEADARIRNLEMISDLSASLNFIDLLRASFFAETRVVDLAMVKDKLARVTNFGVRMIFSDMLDMVDTKRLYYGRGLKELSKRVMTIMGESPDNIFVGFDDPLPIDKLTTLQALQIEQQIGLLSKTTVADEMKRDSEQELRKLEEEKNDSRFPVTDNITSVNSSDESPTSLEEI